eukprot:366523-Chlamydomonas_euryale.AAC.2
MLPACASSCAGGGRLAGRRFVGLGTPERGLCAWGEPVGAALSALRPSGLLRAAASVGVAGGDAATALDHLGCVPMPASIDQRPSLVWRLCVSCSRSECGSSRLLVVLARRPMGGGCSIADAELPSSLPGACSKGDAERGRARRWVRLKLFAASG